MRKAERREIARARAERVAATETWNDEVFALTSSPALEAKAREGKEEAKVPEPTARGGEARTGDEPCSASPSEPGPGASAQDRLWDLYITLSVLRREHVLTEHSQGKVKGKSQFSANYSTKDGLEGLLADGLADLDLGKFEVMDLENRVYLECTMPYDIGHDNYYGKLRPTNRFRVVTRPYWIEAEARYEFDVVTAHPIGRSSAR